MSVSSGQHDTINHFHDSMRYLIQITKTSAAVICHGKHKVPGNSE